MLTSGRSALSAVTLLCVLTTLLTGPAGAAPPADGRVSPVAGPHDGTWQVGPVTSRPVDVAAVRAAGPDPLADQQWAYDMVGDPAQWPHSGAGVVVAVIDTGVDATHEDLVGADILPQVDLLDDGVTNPDPNGHGTAVASVIVAQPGNGVGIVGAAPAATILPIRAFDADGVTASEVVADAIDVAVAADVDVINLSASSYALSEAVAVAVADATDAGVAVVAAAGNGAFRAGYPARFTSTIAVAAVDRDGTKASFSDYGLSVDIAAPGVDIVTAAAGGGYVEVSGTSFAAPLVAAAAASAIGRHGPMDLPTLHATIWNATVPTDPDAEIGHGILDAAELRWMAPAAATGRLVTAAHRPDSIAAAATGDLPAGSVDVGVVATGRGWPDVLAAGPAVPAAPVWLTHPEAGLTDTVLREVVRVMAPGGTVVVAGGTAAVSTSDRDRLRDAGFDLVELAGPDRIGTALALADHAHTSRRSDTAVLTSAASWVDAATAGAYAARLGHPLVVTGPDALDSRVATWLDDTDIDTVVVIGGTAAVSRAVTDDLADADIDTVRLAGSTRFTTATAVADASPTSGTVVLAPVADNDGWAVPLVAGTVAARLDAPLLGTERTRTGQAALDHLSGLAAHGPVDVVTVGPVGSGETVHDAYRVARVAIADDLPALPADIAGPMGPVAHVEPGSVHSCAIDRAGELWCWGTGRIAHDVPLDRPSPVRLDVAGPDVAVVDVAVTRWSTCAVTDTGQLWCVGETANGTDGRAVAMRHVPVPVDVVDVAAGSDHVCAAGTDPAGSWQVWCFGPAADGQTGLPAGSGTAHQPVRLAGLPAGEVLAMMGGRTHTCVAVDTADGAQVWCVGSNHRGQLARAGGGGHVPARGPLLDGATALTGGWDHTCGQVADGSWRCVGGNYGHQFGSGRDLAVGEAVPAHPSTVGTGMSSDALHACTIVSGSRLACHGAAHLGRLGYPGAAWSAPADPTWFAGEPLVGVATGYDSTCTWSASGRMWCAGGNAAGQGGIGMVGGSVPEFMEVRTTATR